MPLDEEGLTAHVDGRDKPGHEGYGTLVLRRFPGVLKLQTIHSVALSTPGRMAETIAAGAER
jgi:hypothetical protein